MPQYKVTNTSPTSRYVPKPIDKVMKPWDSVLVQADEKDLNEAELSKLILAGKIEFLVVDNTDIAPVFSSKFDLSEVEIFDDFCAGQAGGTLGNTNWAANGGGGGQAGNPAYSVNMHPGRVGILVCAVQAVNSYMSLRQGAGLWSSFGNGATSMEGDFYLPSQSPTDKLRCRIGFTSGISNVTDAAVTILGFLSDSANSDFWQLEFKYNDVVLGLVTTNKLCTNFGWVRLRVELSESGQVAQFFINDENVGTISSEYTPVDSFRVSSSVTVMKVAGTGGKSVGIDWIRIKKKMVNPRPLTMVL